MTIHCILEHKDRKFFFFFQAEDGIRDFHVTGVQTCALPIFPLPAGSRARPRPGRTRGPARTWGSPGKHGTQRATADHVRVDVEDLLTAVPSGPWPGRSRPTANGWRCTIATPPAWLRRCWPSCPATGM